jgi:hypothetical protein
MELRFLSSSRALKLFFLSTIILISVFFVMRQRFFWEAGAFFGVSFAQSANRSAAVFGLDAGSTSSKRLKFRDDGSFQLSVFEDLHFGEGEDNREFLLLFFGKMK